MRIMTRTKVPVRYDPGTDDVEGIAQALLSLKARGTGIVTCRKLASKYGRRVIDILIDDYKSMQQKGIGEMRLLDLHNAAEKMFCPELEEQRRSAMREQNERELKYHAFMGSLGISGYAKRAISRKFSEWSVEKIERTIRKNPYQLTDIEGIGFHRADEIAAKIGVAKDHPERIKEGVMYQLQQQADKGHCFVPIEQLVKQSARLLEQPDDTVAAAIPELEDEHRIINDEGRIYQKTLFYDEVHVAHTLRRLMEASGLPPSHITEWGERLHKEYDSLWKFRRKRLTVDYNEQQRDAIEMARLFRVMILTGGPGTGKTTTLLGILNEAKENGWIVRLCAPTGKAAQRMKESTGEDAQTIHRLLSFHPDDGFRKNRQEPLECDLVVVDEASMIDITLMRHLCDAIPYGGRLVIVGDADQLQSVGPGNVLRDLIDSGAIPTARLTQIHRQQAGSNIVRNAHLVINGDMPVVDNMAGSDFFIKTWKKDNGRVPLTENDVIDQIISMVSERLPKAYPDMEVQVLCPRRSDLATSSDKLNPLLQGIINPYGKKMRIGKQEYRLGDRVMQIKNDYDIGRFNGDTGTITEVDNETLTVKFIDGETIYDKSKLHNLQLCYATTIHKSQGSEYDIVVIPMLENASIMLQRNLLYTAITRAKKICIIVGTWRAVQIAVQNWMIKPRWTWLKERINIH